MTHIVSSVSIQTSAHAIPSVPNWFGEVVRLPTHLRKHGVFSKINEQVRFARKRFGRYDVIDFLAVQIALCQKLRAHAGGVLRAASALCCSLHGFV